MPYSRDNTASHAKALWTLEARELSPVEFQSRFDAIYANAEGPATLWHLGGAANDYLRAHPNSIVVPEGLATSLLSAKMVDARIVGLKLLTRCTSNAAAITAAICQALERRHQGELYGGLCELDNLLRRLGSSGRVPAQELSPTLCKLSKSSDPHVRETATRLLDWLDELAAA